MSFGRPEGPPATRRQLAELSELLSAAGHVDFRDARGPMGFTQRQAGGRFTRDEADAFIAQLTAEAEAAEIFADLGVHDGTDAPATAGPGATDAVRGADPSGGPRALATTRPGSRAAPSPTEARPRTRRASAAVALDQVSSDALAAELQRRGWVVVEP